MVEDPPIFGQQQNEPDAAPNTRRSRRRFPQPVVVKTEDDPSIDFDQILDQLENEDLPHQRNARPQQARNDPLDPVTFEDVVCLIRESIWTLKLVAKELEDGLIGYCRSISVMGSTFRSSN